MNESAQEWTDGGLRLEPDPVEPADAELEALEQGALLVPLTDSRLLRLTGSDRVDFLHGQISNDVRGLGPGATNRSLLLNHRGHALADMRVLRYDDEIRVLVDGGGLGVVEESLRRHIIFDQVELERLDSIVALTLQGPSADGVLGSVLSEEVPGEGEFLVTELNGVPLTLVRSRRTAAGGFDLLTEGSLLQPLSQVLQATGAVPVGRPALELGRVVAGIPSASSEGGDGILPQEAGLEPLVSYRKGCYLGQEIMARIEARGKMRRELAGLALDGVPDEGERDVRSDGKSVGRLGRVVRHPREGFLALAVLRSDLPGDAVLEVGGVKGRPTALAAPASL